MAAELSHPSIQDGWFREISDEHFPGQAFELRVEKILFHEKSQFQDILVFKSTDYGNVLVLDGVVQCTERDEFSYQELIAHVPMFAHPSPRKVLIIGGGDGGVLREVLKHEDVIEEVVLVEIDEYVINLSKQYFPEMASGFEHPKAKIVLMDGFQYLKDNQGKFDVIITDSSDPEGPAENFFQVDYFKLLRDSLVDDNGIVISQSSENIWLNLKKLKQIYHTVKEVFPMVKYCYTCTPSYTSGQLGLIVSSKNAALDVAVATRSWDQAKQNNLLRYYNSRLHAASFVLPNAAKVFLEDEN
ncbi:spermine synthase [Saccharomycopsis crataegensis]|uniref:Spermine synthase n=1 Tax=Saccharomycopsis crataegensis TaxID=43959 RepID=A0AAV5QFQ0_9ASCO|nr:spermine synthase [Saccharomycopsis crataegensis]